MMNRYNTLWVSVLIAVMVTSVHANENADIERDLATLMARRSNPFAPLIRPTRPAVVVPAVAASAIDTVGRYEKPDELLLETIDLLHLSAQSASEVFSCLNSEMGKMRAQEGRNRLIVFDTKDNLNRIVTEIKKADQPIESLTLKAVHLEFLDVNTAASVLVRFGSDTGCIVLVDRSNTLILCDTKRHVEIMIKELKTLDQPIVGMTVEPIVLQYIDAKSAQEALSILLSEYGTMSVVERTNSLAVCDLPKNIQAIRTEAQNIDKETPGLSIKTVNLKFLQAQSLVPILMKMVSQYGTVSANDASNSIIICDTPENVARMVVEVKTADQTPRQIMVEVVLLDVRLGDDRSIGVNWDLLSTDGDLSSRLSSGTITGTPTLAPPVSLSAIGIGGDGSFVAGDMRALIHTIQSKRDVEIIASPRAMVVSGQTAVIRAVEEIPYIETSNYSQGGALTSTEFKPVGVTLEVTASLTEDNDIFLIVDIEQNVRTGESRGVPVVDTRSETTNLLLEDGKIAIMGGLRRREKTQQITQVPIVGDIPILGHLFRNTQEVIQNSELVILISPHIYAGEPVQTQIMKRYYELDRESPISGSHRLTDQPTLSATGDS